MDVDQYNYFKLLRQDYYLAGRCLLINQMFKAAGINFGYSVELTLKFILAFRGAPRGHLMKHTIRKYYSDVIKLGYLEPVNASDDFLRFVDERLNARYPSLISRQFSEHQTNEEAYVFTIDMLHCYDDFILQLDDAVTQAVGDPRISIGFRSCRKLESAVGRIFFHCNDHAFQRIPRYLELLRDHRDDGDGFEQIESTLRTPENLWNFKGMMAYRPWGPKADWTPAQLFSIPKFEDGKVGLRAASWSTNEGADDVRVSSLEVSLPKGTYEFEGRGLRINRETDPVDDKNTT